MTSPKRIQRQRAKGWRKPEGAVDVTRPGCWGNPFRVGDSIFGSDSGVATIITPEFAVDMFRVALVSGRMAMHGGYNITVEDVRRELAGVDLMCWCKLVDATGQPVACHADVLLEIANGAEGKPWTH